MKTKMTLQEFTGLFPGPIPYGYKPLKATKKGFAHVHNPHWMPPKSKVTPKNWESQQRELKTRNAKPTKKGYICPTCEKPCGKLDYCETDKKWPVLKESK